MKDLLPSFQNPQAKKHHKIYTFVLYNNVVNKEIFNMKHVLQECLHNDKTDFIVDLVNDFDFFVDGLNQENIFRQAVELGNSLVIKAFLDSCLRQHK